MLINIMLTKKQVQHVAKLARLGITKKEEEKFAKELSAILEYFKELQKIDTSKVEPSSHPFALKNVLREDKAEEQIIEKADRLLRAVPARKDRHVKTKPIL